MLKGIPVSGGAAIGKIFRLEEEPLTYDAKAFSGVRAEKERYEQALSRFTEQTEGAVSALRRIVGTGEAAIFTGHIYMAQDPEMKKTIHQKIASGFNAELAMESACDSFIERFLRSESALTKQRAADVKDIKSALLALLVGKEKVKRRIPPGSVLAAGELTPSAAEWMDRRKTVAVLTESGDAHAHLAVLLRAMGIPAVFSVRNLMNTVRTGQKVLVDGKCGEVIELNSNLAH